MTITFGILHLPPTGTSLANYTQMTGYGRNRIKHETPNSLLDWMMQAVREHIRQGGAENIETPNLRLWGFARQRYGSGFGIQWLGDRRSKRQWRGTSYHSSAIDEETELTRV